MRPYELPSLSIVVLVGVSGAGKSTFAARHFKPTEVLSSDRFRGLVADDESDQTASADAFEAMRQLAAIRLRRGLLTVIDATNVRPEDRQDWLNLAKAHDVLPVAVVLDVPVALAVARNAARPDRDFGAGVVQRHHGALKRSVRGLRDEGFRYVYTLSGVERIDEAVFERKRPWTDRSDQEGPFDIIGDVHGCGEELRALLDELGWVVSFDGVRHSARHPEGRTLVFLGDLVDRGPEVSEVLHLVMDLVAEGSAMCVPGNHEIKLLRWLRGKNPSPTHGLSASIASLSARDEAFRDRVASFIDGLVSHYVLDRGRLVVAHAGMTEAYAGRASGRVRQFALFGETTGEIDAYGLPVRADWAASYRGRAAVVYGHTPTPTAEWVNGTLCVDTGCVFGGALTALRWPEREIVSVPAARVYCEPVRPLAPPSRPQQAGDPPPDVNELITRVRLETRFAGAVALEGSSMATAIEVMSRFAAHPKHVLYLPPTMAPVETSSRPGLLEHPDEAFAYYRAHGVRAVVCEEKHMGSRAVVWVTRSPEASERLGIPPGGVILTRRGRRFFPNPALEAQLLDRVRAGADRAGTWDELATDWLLLDAELMPWSVKAQDLLVAQYAPVGAAATASLGAAAAAMARAAERASDPLAIELAASLSGRLSHAEAYQRAWRRYSWPVGGVDDLRLAPFHLLASEGRVHHDQDHAWHLSRLAALAGDDPVLQTTRHQHVDLGDEAAVARATSWWEDLTASGGEGMVVKPSTFLARERGRLLQPALKVRGPEYLRIIYGPEYLLHLDRLRKRGVARKRQLALREFALGLEGLERFVAGEGMARWHPCVLGVLALEAEDVDPRL
jgi:protein phosphatase